MSIPLGSLLRQKRWRKLQLSDSYVPAPDPHPSLSQHCTLQGCAAAAGAGGAAGGPPGCLWLYSGPREGPCGCEAGQLGSFGVFILLLGCLLLGCCWGAAGICWMHDGPCAGLLVCETLSVYGLLWRAAGSWPLAYFGRQQSCMRRRYCSNPALCPIARAGNNPIMLVGTKVDLLPPGTDPVAVAEWLAGAAAYKRINSVSVHLVRCAAWPDSWLAGWWAGRLAGMCGWLFGQLAGWRDGWQTVWLGLQSRAAASGGSYRAVLPRTQPSQNYARPARLSPPLLSPQASSKSGLLSTKKRTTLTNNHHLCSSPP